jgi:hypothetical protein
MFLKYYLYGMLFVGVLITASNLHFSIGVKDDSTALQSAVIRGLRYGLPWPMTALNLHSKYTKGEDWMEILKPAN